MRERIKSSSVKVKEEEVLSPVRTRPKDKNGETRKELPKADFHTCGVSMPKSSPQVS